MKTRLAMVSGLCLLCSLGVQFIRPRIETPITRFEVTAPPEATRMLRTSCYSCHSNERRLAWFDEVVPAYWLVRHDIVTARGALNFSALGARPAAAQRAALFEAANMASLGAMPPKSFSFVHPEARINPIDLDQLKTYLAPWHDLPSEEPDPPAFSLSAVVERTASGLQFDESSTHWHLLSLTDRGDNNSFRFILGNDTATQAARAGQANPWPEGTRFAKVALQQRSAPDGTIRPGHFIQVELMVKDTHAEGPSDGWEWGRWKGEQLRPYGDKADVVKECTGCHAPMKRNDFVYTMPIAAHPDSADQFNSTAATMPRLPFDPFAASPITVYVDRKRSTISALFSRDSVGDELLLITWTERDDPHWFGARIPGEFLSAEYVRKNGFAKTFYSQLLKQPVSEARSGDSSQARIDFIERLQIAPYLAH